VCFAKDNCVIQALQADGTDDPFRISVLPWRAVSSRMVANTKAIQAAVEDSAITGVMIANQMMWGFVPGEGFGQLLSNPFRGWVECGVCPNQLPAYPRTPRHSSRMEFLEATGRSSLEL
jgi:hypothetical protein